MRIVEGLHFVEEARSPFALCNDELVEGDEAVDDVMDLTGPGYRGSLLPERFSGCGVPMRKVRTRRDIAGEESTLQDAHSQAARASFRLRPRRR
jgi:hypothetical protein